LLRNEVRKTSASAADIKLPVPDKRHCIVGSPETVRRRLGEAAQNLGYGVVLSLLQFGTLSHELTIRNMKLFSTEVVPALR